MGCTDGFPDFTGDNYMLDSLDFDELLMVINDGELVLPDLKTDPVALLSVAGQTKDDESATATSTFVFGDVAVEDTTLTRTPEANMKNVLGPSSSGSDLGSGLTSSNLGEETMSKCAYRKKSLAQPKNSSQGKRKVKVDWTPELHKRFVQSVEKLGLDKAVPSRILEHMGVQCLTRHNIASHLQKYRSHNKHLQAREAHLTRKWNRMPKMGRAGGKRGIKPSWLSPPVGFFPPQTPHVSPLHVWGHPFLSQSLGHMWLNHLVAPSWSAPAAWSFAATPPPPQTDFCFWHSYNNECRRGAAVVSGTDHLPMYGLHPSCVGVPAAQTIPTPPLDSHPAKEMIDTAIGDVLSKPWLPLPVGLKPPSIDSIMKELQRHGISMVPTPRCRRV